ncbi:MAG: glutathione S-transferase family protein [Hyphomicrobiaceae bacterium]
MAYRLYNRVGSGGFVVEVALTLAGVEFELVELDSRPGTALPESFREINPWGQVPTLVLPDGSTMTETAAILVHLAACHPHAELAPAPGSTDHAQFLRWLVFANVNIYESVLRRIYPMRYTTDPESHTATREAAVARSREALAVVDDAVADKSFLLGETMTLADVYVAMLFIWCRDGTEAPNLARLTDGVRRHGIVAPLWRRHFGER